MLRCALQRSQAKSGDRRELPLLIVLEKLLGIGMNAVWAISVYLIVSIGISVVLHVVDRRLSGQLRAAFQVQCPVSRSSTRR